MKVQVQVGKIGFFGNTQRYEGDVFEIPDQPRRPASDKEKKLKSCQAVVAKDGTVPEAWSSLWMQKAPQGAKERITTAQEAVNKQNAAHSHGFTGPGAAPNSMDPQSPAGGSDQAGEQSPL